MAQALFYKAGCRIVVFFVTLGFEVVRTNLLFVNLLNGFKMDLFNILFYLKMEGKKQFNLIGPVSDDKYFKTVAHFRFQRESFKNQFQLMK